MKYTAIAIDGPSGAGKSTLARALAQKLNYLYVDTGAIYRTLGLFALTRGVPPTDAEAVKALLPQTVITMDYGSDGFQHMYLGGEDVTQAIRTPEVSDAASKVSAIPSVRAFLMDLQRDMAKTHNVIMDGRDIGTVVLPDADLKIFLTAAPEARAQRRWKELQAKGLNEPYETVLAEILERDRRDTTRSTAPLKKAADAVEVDTTDYDLEGSLALLLRTVKERLSK